MAGSFYTREVGVLAEVSVTEQVLWEISKFPEILGKLSMHKQCVPGSFLPAHAREPGNEATKHKAFSDKIFTRIALYPGQIKEEK